MRTMTSALNKLSDSNFKTLKNGIIGAMLTSPDDATDAVLAKCFQEPSYLPLYTRLLSEALSASLSEESNARIRSRISEFAEDMRDMDLDHAVGVSPNSSEDYDGFCAWTKRKRILLGKNRTLTQFVRCGIVLVPSEQQYFDGLVSRLAGCGTDEHAELMLDMVADFVRVFPHPSKWSAIKDALDRATTTGSARSRFKAMDVFQLCT